MSEFTKRLLLRRIVDRANFYARCACVSLRSGRPDQAGRLAARFSHYMDLYNWAVGWLA